MKNPPCIPFRMSTPPELVHRATLTSHNPDEWSTPNLVDTNNNDGLVVRREEVEVRDETNDQNNNPPVVVVAQPVEQQERQPLPPRQQRRHQYPRRILHAPRRRGAQNQHLFNFDREIEEHEVIDVEGGPPNDPQAPQEDIDLKFSSNFHVIRHLRKLNRSEVLAFVCVNVTVICIILLAHLGMHALGYHKDKNVISPSHIPRTFSWKLLQEFFLADALTSLQKECMYFSRKRLVLGSTNGKDNKTNGTLIPNTSPQNLLQGQKLPDSRQELEDEIISNVKVSGTTDNWKLAALDTDGTLNHTEKCVGIDGDSDSYDEWNFMRNYLRTMLLPIINVMSALIFLLIIACRRRRLLQCLLIMPSFISFFLAIFQQIPLTFSYSYSNMILLEGMHSSLSMAMAPYIIPPIWEETQIHGRCCGINSGDTWTVGIDAFPVSCCDTTKSECRIGTYPTRQEIWKKGCFRDEEAKLNYYKMYALLLLTVKLIAEIGIFWSLADLTRYDYPPENQLLNSTCIACNYEVRTKGIVMILGVTANNKMIVKLKRFGNRVGLLKYRIDRAGPHVQVIVRFKHGDQVLGLIECHRQVRRENQNGPQFDFHKGQRLGVIIISF